MPLAAIGGPRPPAADAGIVSSPRAPATGGRRRGPLVPSQSPGRRRAGDRRHGGCAGVPAARSHSSEPQSVLRLL
eukprot:gene1933-5700_t